MVNTKEVGHTFQICSQCRFWTGDYWKDDIRGNCSKDGSFKTSIHQRCLQGKLVWNRLGLSNSIDARDFQVLGEIKLARGDPT
jgi:hypothetical protein